MFYRLLYFLILIPVSLLPLFLQKRISDFFFVLLFYLTGYRKKIVLQNLRNSFPGKTEGELRDICRRFYRHLCDTIFEAIMIFSISKRRLSGRIYCKNPQVIDMYFEKGRSVIIAIGHYNSWEMFLTGLNTLIKAQVAIIYYPLTDSFMEYKMKKAREKFGTKMITKEEVKAFFTDTQPKPTATLFAIDQWPGNTKKAYWMDFLNQETAVAFGTEKYACDFELPVLYARINKERRGHYSIEFIEVCDSPKGTDYGYITEKVTRVLESDIKEKPEFWLWSHRRWKMSRKEIEASA